MSRRSVSAAVIAIVAAGCLAWAPTADAQTLVPDVQAILGGGDESNDEKPQDSDEKQCGSGVTIICARDTLIDGAGDAITGAVETAGDAVMGGVVSWAADGASWLVVEIGRQIDRSTRPEIGSSWFAEQYASVRRLAIALAVLFLLAAAIQAVLRQDARLLARAALVSLPLAMLLTFAAITLVELALALTDWMTEVVLRSFGRDARSALHQLGDMLKPTAITGNPFPGLVTFLAAALTAILALVVWIELVLREASNYVAVCFLPLSLMGLIWPPTANWSRRLVEWLGAIILAKFTIALAFAIAGSALSHAAQRGGGGLTALLAGCAVLLIAALTPFVLLRILPGSASATHGLQRGAVRQAVRSTAGASTASAITRQAMLRGFAPGKVAAVAAPASRPSVPPPPEPPKPPQDPRLHSPEKREPTTR